MTRAFSIPWNNPDIDVNPEPPEGWHRVAVCTLWGDPKKACRRWPYAAVVGPLRTLRGIDLLVQSLLANPQIRYLVIDGRDITEGEPVLKALVATWRGATTIAPDIQRAFSDQVRMIYLTAKDSFTDADIDACRLNYKDRGEPILLPPPAPTATARAPAGDPGERIAGETLADVWPRTLARILTCGREVPTQYGPTRELLGLVSVIRDPRGTVEEIAFHKQPGTEPNTEPFATASHPVLGFSLTELEAYTERLTTAAKAAGASYSYGSRMAGARKPCLKCRYRAGELLDSYDAACSCDRGEVSVLPDQHAKIRALLREAPLARSAYLTPWVAALDCGEESGRPCLVGVQFRARPAPRREGCPGTSDNGGEAFACHLGPDHSSRCCFGGEHHGTKNSPHPHTCLTLDMLVTFRSHDAFSGYPQNIAACCLWLVRLAELHEMDVGQLVCVSNSAHLYERDWAPTQEVVEAYEPPAIHWDQRSAWRVETASVPDGKTLCRWCENGKVVRLRASNRREEDATCSQCNGTGFRLERPVLRATALSPDGADVLQVFEASNAWQLRRAIEASGLVTCIGAALWLGAELERVSQGRSR